MNGQNLFARLLAAIAFIFLFSYANAEVRSSIVTQGPVTDGVWHYSTGLLAWCNTSPSGTTTIKGFTREEAATNGVKFLASPSCTYTDCRFDGIYSLHSVGTTSWKFNWYECDFDPRISTPSLGKILSCLPPSVSNGSVCVGPIYSCPPNEGWKLSEDKQTCYRPHPKTPGFEPSTCEPIAISTGNKFLIDPIYRGKGLFPLTFTRIYNSADYGHPTHWRPDYLARVVRNTGSTTIVEVLRGNGKTYTFTKVSSVWVPDADISDKLVQLIDGSGNTTGWQYTNQNDEVETFNANGRIVSITNRNGLTHTITYSDGTTGANGGYIYSLNGTPTTLTLPAGRPIRITDSFGRSIKLYSGWYGDVLKLTDPANQAYKFSVNYSDRNQLSVTYPDNKVKQYLYNEPAYTGGISQIHAITGVIDENNDRYATYYYDSTGRAIKEELAPAVALGIGEYELSYTADANNNPITTVVTDPLGTSRTYSFETVLNVPKTTGQTQPAGAGCAASSSAKTYDANGNVASSIDFNGNKTTFTYDLTRNLETSRTEGLTSVGAATPSTRTITTSWHSTWRLPATITEYAGATASGTPLRETSYSYDSKANLTQKVETDPVNNISRTTTITYTYSTVLPALALTKVVDGPRTDVSDITTYTYYDANNADLARRGNLASITNALGHVTQFTSYNLHGQVLTIVDPNGVTITNTYDTRQRLLSRTVGTETTGFEYDGVGQLTKLTFPDASTLDYTYDAAHRLTQIEDSLGNQIIYTLDAMGNRIQEDVKDPQGTLARTLTRSYDALSRLQTQTGIDLE